MPDYPVLLNSFLQGHRTGNLTEYFKYEMSREGPEDNVIHIATVRGVTYCVGRGRSKGAAKGAAAQVIYEEFLANGVPGTLPGREHTQDC